ncbi:2OG-Fe(II) oxygenase [Dyella sp. LX-66]|uniref:2OG-Fe(II) oxygenase n=1 Tax=unclassified Dyella TaxID=2634549 RepID=UPI001BE10CD9|nr:MULTISPECIES: 2OG-Fe(II) oxygenase [unclassified Dyella]MBT2116286.1 2OG-Fe(II) oxygenase [Dyella sp. LX-1]MBT2140771.1 2OG-Fe(II) oxygenase [Dyella sp. LX-66]
MKSFHKTRPELRDWILATARGGHTPLEVVKLMQEAGYDQQQCHRAVAEVLGVPLAALNATIPRAGAKRTTHPAAPSSIADGHPVRVSTSLDSPVVRVLDGLLTDGECEELIGLASPRLARSLTVDEAGRHQTDERRTSNGMFFRLAETPLIERIERRIAKLVDLPMDHGEGLQVLHYQPGQEYEPHFDWFDPTQPGFAAVTARGGQRIASIVMYLNTPEEGGGTGFPAAGLTVTALRGSAVYFAYDTGDQSSLHAGLPVLKGEKWIATKWLRERPYQR